MSGARRWCAAAMLAASAAWAQPAAGGADGLPAYRRVTFVELYAAVRDPAERGIDHPFTVIGTVEQTRADGSLVVLGRVVACCTTHGRVRVEVRGADSGAAGVGDWVAVLGRLRGGEDGGGRSRRGVLAWGWGGQGGSGPPGVVATIDAEHVVPAEMVTREGLVFDRLESAGYATLARALRESGAEDAMWASGQVTLLAPADLTSVGGVGGRASHTGAGREAQRRAVLGQMVPGRLAPRELRDGDVVTTLGGQRLEVRVRNGVVRIGGARVLFVDSGARDGVVFFTNVLAASGETNSEGGGAGAAGEAR